MPENKPSTSFLSLVAEDLIQRFGTDLAKVVVVFPSIRASLFFNTYLYQHAQKSLWAPQYKSIDSLFEENSDLRKGDNIQLIGELYQTYIDVYNSHASTPSKETLDEFFFFGEILLNDFDDVDKNLVNARLLFSNLQNIDELRDDFSHLSEEQIQALTRYFKHAFQGESSLKTAFWNIWNILGEVYLAFKTKLHNKKIAYPGMLMRDALENPNAEFTAKHYVFVGFNVLNKCEEQLFEQLKPNASFYWDYDQYYLKTEAGRFIKRNIQKFGSALDDSLFDSFLNHAHKVSFIASSSENGQAAVIPDWIKSLNEPSSFTRPDSAIVLCNENILPTVMHSIPPQLVENVNITMGFPLTQTPVSSFLQVLTELQTKGYISSSKAFRFQTVLPVLRHPYTQIIFPEAKDVEKNIVENNIFFPDSSVLKDDLIFSHTPNTSDLAQYLLNIIQKLGIAFGKEETQSDIYNDLYQESIFRAYQIINRLNGLLISEEWSLEKPIFLRLLRKLLSTVKIPFHGEPVKGLQIMGVLETRTLDFKNLLLLSVNEGFMPGNTNDNTFIPQFLRVHFGLSTIDHQDSVYAYYFYRLIQRSEKVTLVYNTDKTQTGKSEMSRFLLQLLIDPQLKNRIKRFSLQSNLLPWQPEAIKIEKDAKILQQIREKYDWNINPQASKLSPTALNTYINCSFKFYQQYIEGLKSNNDLSDELDSSIFGSIFHRAAEYLYRAIGNLPDEGSFTPFVIQKERLEPYLKAPHLIEKLVTRAFEKEYFKDRKADLKKFNGEQLINFKVICHILKRLICFDSQRTPFTLYGLEYPVSGDFYLNKANAKLRIGGIIDRLEEKEGKFYILDYKTSGKAKTYKELSDLFIADKKRASHIFQTFIYASVLLQNKNFNLPIVPGLLYLQEAGKDDYSPVIVCDKKEITDFQEYREEFEALLIQKTEELFNPEIPFEQTTITETCEYCDFKEMCNR